MRKMHAFFLIDPIVRRDQRYSVIRNGLYDLFEKFQATIDITIIRMGTKSQELSPKQVVEPLNDPTHCNLEDALKLKRGIISDLIEEGQSIPIFLLLQSQPTGQWQKVVNLYKKNQVRFIVFDLADKKIPNSILQKIDKNPYRLKDKDIRGKYVKEIFSYIEIILENLVSKRKSDANIEAPPDLSMVDSQGIAAIWEDNKPEETDYYPVPNSLVDHKSDEGGWFLLGASQRGKMHAHQGTFREDSFALETIKGWHLMVVADGGGSYAFSRAGATLATETAVDVMKGYIENNFGTETTSLSNKEICKNALEEGVKAAWLRLQQEAEDKPCPFKELGTTFLALIHYATENLVGVLQIGDGVVAVEYEDGELVVLAEPDVGQSASVTLFLTSKHWESWLDRVKVEKLPKTPHLLATMCDGVSDDFIPYKKHLPKLFNGLKNHVVLAEKPTEKLLTALAYEKRGSFDDRTLTLIYRLQEIEDSEDKAKEGDLFSESSTSSEEKLQSSITNNQVEDNDLETPPNKQANENTKQETITKPASGIDIEL